MGIPLSKDSRALVAFTPQQRRDLVAFARRTLGSSMHYMLRFWIFVTGLERHEELFRKLFLQFKYRHYSSANSPLNAYHCMGMTIVELWLRTLRVVLVPDVFVRFLCATFVLHIFYEMKSRAKAALHNAALKLTARGRKQARLTKLMAHARSFQERQTIAGELDKIQGKDRWREDAASGLYLYERVMNKTQVYKRLHLENDVMGLMFALRAGLLRKHWGLGNPRLYSVSHVGTKHVIEEYLDTIVQSMNTVLRATGTDDETKEELSIDNKLAFFSETRHAFGRSALLLSGGGALGFYHAGVVKALNENHLLPNVIAGASAGSIVAGIVGVRTDEEVAEFFSDTHLDLAFLSVNITQKDYDQFTPAIVPVLEKVLPRFVFHPVRDVLVLANRYVAKGYLLDGNVLRDALRKNIGEYTFREAYDRTGRIINMTVTPTKSDDYPHLLNYLTAPNVLIWSASLASCAIPLVFPPVELLSKDKYGNTVPYYREGLKWSDGSIECDLPMERLSELFNVNHFVVSQVNIHYKVVSGHTAFGFGQTGSLLSFLKKQMKAYIKNIAELGLNTNVLKFLDIGLIPLITQKYEGDITVCPTDEYSMLYLLRTSLANPTKDSFQQIIASGERASWPHISRVRTMCRIEFALERAVRYLRGEQAIEDERKHGRTAIGRVPSFYTSPSSMNLSSLDANADANSPTSHQSQQRRIFGSEDSNDPTASPMRRNRSVNVAGAVMTMELAAGSRNSSFSRFSDVDG